MRNRELLLSEADQSKLTISLFRDGLFGIKEDPEDFITLKSKRKSPHYLDIRPGVSDYSTRQRIATTMGRVATLKASQKAGRHQIINQAYQHIVGTPEAMTSFATSIADRSMMSLLQPRVDLNKSSGNKSPILGRYKSGDNVAAFDDVVTDGKSKIDTIESLGALGLEVSDYFVVVDREEGGAPQVLEATGIEITPALAVSSMVKMLFAESQINQSQYDNVAEYIGQYGDPLAKASFGIE